MMRLLFLEQRPQFGGGSERMSLALNAHAVSKGHRTWIVHAVPGDMVAAYARAGAVSAQLPIVPVAIRKPWSAGRSITHLSWFVRRHRIDLVFTSQVNYVSLLGAVSALTGVRTGLHLGLVYDYPSPLFQAGSRRVHVAIAPSAHTADGWRAHGWPDASLRVIPNAIDTERFMPADGRSASRARLGIGHGTSPMIAYVGRLVPEKGVHTLMRAFGKLRRQGAGATLVFVGATPGDDAPRLRQSAAEAGVPDEAWSLHDARPDPEDVYRAADLVVVPSECDEAFGLVPLEALACGTMTVVSDRGIMPTFVASAGTHAVFPAGDADALACRLHYWLQDVGRRERAAARLSRKTVESYSFAPCGDAYLAAFESVLHQ